MEPTTRLKCLVGSVKRVTDSNGDISQEEISLNAVYDNRQGSANSQWCKWTPSCTFNFTVSNKNVFGKILPGQFYFIDLILTDKESL